jgi:hypothetical protein
MKPAWKKILPPVATALIVLILVFLMVRPDQFIGAAIVGLFLVMFWAIFRFLPRGRSRQD